MKRTIGLLAGALLAAAILAAPASAATVGLGGGNTTLRLSSTTAQALESLGVAVSPIGPARAAAGGVRFPVSGGSINPNTAAGRIAHRGGLELAAGSTRVRLRNFIIRVARQPTISVNVGGRRLHAFSLSLADARVARAGLDTVASGVRVRLTAKGAAALNGAFGVDAFRRGLSIGTARVVAEPDQLAFAGGATSLALDPGTAQALTTLGVSAGPAAPATANPNGSLSFPISGGKVDAESLAGTITHTGGITFARGATRLTVTDFIIDTAPDPELTALAGGSRIDLLSLDLSGLERSLDGREVTLSGVVGRLTAPAAAALNQTFGTSAFREGLTIGTATVAGELA